MEQDFNEMEEQEVTSSNSKVSSEAIVQTILNRLHQTLYQHFVSNGMPKTANSFLQESKFFPDVKGTTRGYPSDTLFRCWSSNYFENNMLGLPIPVEDDQLSGTARDVPSNSNELEEGSSAYGKRVVFPCRFPGCTSTFRTPANKKRHEKLHTGEKPFECTYDNCDKRFARKYDLKIHMRTHTKEKPYSCEICEKKFSRVSSLKEHQRNLHQNLEKLPRKLEEPESFGVAPGFIFNPQDASPFVPSEFLPLNDYLNP